MKSTINSHVRWIIMIVTAWRLIYFSPDKKGTEWHFCLILLNYSVYVTLFSCDIKIYFLKVMFLTRCALCFCITVYFPGCHSVLVGNAVKYASCIFMNLSCILFTVCIFIEQKICIKLGGRPSLEKETIIFIFVTGC